MTKAKPIWIKNTENEMNIHAVFRTVVKVNDNACLYVAGTTFYRIYINGEFIGAGPARTAKGYLREDVFRLKHGENEIIIEAVGYNCCSLSTVCQTSYIMAEVTDRNGLIAYSGRDFEGFLPGCKIQKTERYSVQRHFTEIWDYRGKSSLTDGKHKREIVCINEKPKVIDRVAPYPLYEDIKLAKSFLLGNFAFDETLPYKEKRYSWKDVPKSWGRFEWEEVPHPYTWIQRQRQTVTSVNIKLPITLNGGEFAVFDFERIEAGFLKAFLDSLQESDIILAFNECFEGEMFEVPQNMNVHNVIEYYLPKGENFKLQSFEPYTCRFLMIAVRKGSICLNGVGIKTYMFNTSDIKTLNSDNEALNDIYKAGIRTFAHNSVDLYYDCPSRERAGWLCDSYFTAKTEYSLTGKTRVEDAFLENYRLFKNTGEYPDGVLPECYPSDYPLHEGHFIPQWTMWYILEVEEYINKRGHKDMMEKFRESIYGLLKFYAEFENDDGLLENIVGWNFVEWSIANDWTSDVNYPTQFLYAKALECVYLIYGDKECLEKSKKVREAATEQSFNGEYFLDHSVRNENGDLELQQHSSEAGQYYAILFGDIDINSEKYSNLKNLVLNVFSPKRDKEYPQIFPVNAFIGAYLRMEALLKMKEYDLALRDVEGFFGNMAKETETLWEYRSIKGSKDHGFASYALVVIKESLKAKNQL